MTANTNKKEKNLKNNNIVYIIESVILTAAAIFLSVVSSTLFSSTLFIDIIGLACVAIASALFACVLFLTKSRVIIPAAAVSFAVTFILTGEIISSCASLFYIIVGLFIYFGVKGKNNRTRITVGIAAVLTVLYLIILISSVVLSVGTFSVREIVSTIDEDITSGLDGYIDRYSDVFMQYSGAGISDSATDAERAAYFENYKKELVMNIKAILPACFVIYNLFIAYLSTALFKHSYNIFIPMANPDRNRIKNKYWRVNISAVSAIIMIIAMFLEMIFSSNDSNLIGYIVMTNFIYILIPGFTVMGIYFSRDKMFKSGTGFFPVMLIIGVIMLAFIFPIAIFAAILFFMLLGIYAALISDIKKYYDKLKKILLGDDDDDDDDYID